MLHVQAEHISNTPTFQDDEYIFTCSTSVMEHQATITKAESMIIQSSILGKQSILVRVAEEPESIQRTLDMRREYTLDETLIHT